MLLSRRFSVLVTEQTCRPLWNPEADYSVHTTRNWNPWLYVTLWNMVFILCYIIVPPHPTQQLVDMPCCPVGNYIHICAPTWSLSPPLRTRENTVCQKDHLNTAIYKSLIKCHLKYHIYIYMSLLAYIFPLQSSIQIKLQYQTHGWYFNFQKSCEFSLLQSLKNCRSFDTYDG